VNFLARMSGDVKRSCRDGARMAKTYLLWVECYGWELSGVHGWHA